MRLRSRRNLRLFIQFFWFFFLFLNTNTCGSSGYASVFNFFGSFLKHKYVWELRLRLRLQFFWFLS